MREADVFCLVDRTISSLRRMLELSLVEQSGQRISYREAVEFFLEISFTDAADDLCFELRDVDWLLDEVIGASH